MAAGFGCACCGGLAQYARGPVGRRSLLLGAGAGMLLPGHAALAKAKYGAYEAMVLGCIDPRLQRPMLNYMSDRDLDGKYSKFAIAGAAIGVVAPAFDKWHQAFWDNLAASIELHHIKMVIAIDHRDCGAAKLAYGEASIATPEKENETHRAAMAEFRKQVAARQPTLAVETILMGLDGSEMPLT